MRGMVHGVGVALLALGLAAVPAQAAKPAKPLQKVRHIVVIYEENHSFDNLYGGWEKVTGLKKADPAHTTQVDQSGATLSCLPQDDVNLAAAGCFANKPFHIDGYITPSDTTCPKPGVFAPNGVPKGTGEPGGCTRDLVHRFYQEQYQMNGGAHNRYVAGSDAIGLTMGAYRTRALPIYRYLHRPVHQRYAIADRFYQGAFGGSFLNHQWLAAARTPVWHNAPADQHSILDSAAMPTSYPLYKADRPVKDAALTQACGLPTTVAGVACGDWAVNTIQPPYQPHASGAQLPPQTSPTIGDRLTAKGISWAWYSGGWSNANGDVGAPGWTNGSTPGTCSDPNTATGSVYPNCPDKLFQYHHQPLNYYASFAPGTAQRSRDLRDEQEFIDKAKASGTSCKLRKVSFIKPVGAENEHPGYASEHGGSDHLVSLLRTIHRSSCRKGTMVIVTYDEFGGQWDHMPSPGQAGGPAGPSDEMGPGTRIPALVVSPLLSRRFAVDSAPHDTTSILATIEHRFKVRALNSRDRKVQDLSTAFTAGG